jgi:hypothetical protein
MKHIFNLNSILAVVVTFLMACNSKQKIELNNKTLTLTRVSSTLNKADENNYRSIEVAILNSDINKPTTSKEMQFIFFGPDTCVLLYEGDYENLSYKVNAKNNRIDFLMENGETLKLDSVKINSSAIAANIENNYKRGFFDITSNFKNAQQEAMHPVNNLWRKKAFAKQTDKEHLARIQNLLQHYILIIENSETRKKEQVSFEYSKSIINIYDGGIGLKSYPDSKWLNLFFDYADSQRFNALFVEVLRDTPAPTNPSSNNWMKDDVELLKSLLTTTNNKLAKI